MKYNNIFYNKNFDFFYDKIKSGHPFKYSRFNDGEFIAISNKYINRWNCDGHLYFESMGKELKNVLLNYQYSDNYVIESFYYWYKTIPVVRDQINFITGINKNLGFLNEDFIRMSHEKDSEKFLDLLNLLKTKNVYIIGPSYLEKLNKFFNFKYINVPLNNSYLKMNEIKTKINKIDKEYKENNYPVVFLFSMGMASSIIIDYFKNSNNIFIDWGSVWDTFFVSPEYSFIKKRSTSNKKRVIENYKKYLI